MSVARERTLLSGATIRFAGDSGDGMQLTGTQFTTTSATVGNDISTFPDFPAEIRAPAGTVAGVSGFQIHFASSDIHTPGDRPDVLVAMNPAALKANLADLVEGGLLITNSDAFNDAGFKKAGYSANPLTDAVKSRYRHVAMPITDLTNRAVESAGLSKKLAERCKNLFALGVMYYLYDRPMDVTLEWLKEKFAHTPEVLEANRLALLGGYNYADTTEIFGSTYQVPRAQMPTGHYRSVTGNEAIAMGFVAAAARADKMLFYGSYPITPASDVLHELAKLRHFGVVTFQAEDEIAAVGASIGAAYGGSLAVTGTSGPGLCLKSEAINLAIMTELPLVVLDVQRAGPSTGMPTKTEQSDLLQAMYGRNGDSPLVLIAPATPAECFHYAFESIRIATRFMTPVILLSDGYIANGAEPWIIPKEEDLPSIHIDHEYRAEEPFLPYRRDPETLARHWAIPGKAGLEHRIGGIEKEDVTGNISYEPMNHQQMTNLRAAKVAGIAKDIPALEVYGDANAETLIVGWGGTYGSLYSAVERLNREGHPIAGAHFRYLNPFPANTGEVLKRYGRVICAELNTGQLSVLLHSRFDKRLIPLCKVQGKPFHISEIVAFVKSLA